MFKESLIRKILLLLVILGAALISYFLIFLQFFQQDEWHGFGIILSQGTRYITLDKGIFELILGDRVGARIITFSLFKFFHLNPLPYGIVATAFHLLNSVLVYKITKKMSKDQSASLLASLLFLINEVGNEAYSWFGTMAGSLPSVSLFLLSFLFFLKFIEEKKKINVLVSAFLLWFSFLFKEVGAFAFILYPIVFFLYNPKIKYISSFIKSYFPFLALGSIMIIFFIKTALFIPGNRANYVNTQSNLISTIITHSIQYPLEGIIETAIPNQTLFALSDITTKIINPNLDVPLDILVANQTYNAEITIIIILITLTILLSLFIWRNYKKINNSHLKTLAISISITILSFIPYIVINRSFSYLDSRYYYLATVGTSIFISILFFVLWNTNKIAYKITAFLLIFSYLLIHSSVLYSDFNLLADRAAERKLFINQLEKIKPNLENKTIFYITGNSGGYYALPELKVPFQSGLGQMLMVIYVDKKQLDKNFLNETSITKLQDVGFLYDILGQGYRDIDGKKFGYYYDINELKKNIDNKSFEKKDIIPLYYDADNKKLNPIEIN